VAIIFVEAFIRIDLGGAEHRNIKVNTMVLSFSVRPN